MVSDGKYATVNKVRDFNAGTLTQGYLETHHQANLNQVPSRRSFVEAVMVLLRKQIGAFCKGFLAGKLTVTTEFHYHVALKLDRCKLWLSRKNCL